MNKNISLNLYKGDSNLYTDFILSEMPKDYIQEWKLEIAQSIKNNIDNILNLDIGITYGFYLDEEIIGFCRLKNIIIDESYL